MKAKSLIAIGAFFVLYACSSVGEDMSGGDNPDMGSGSSNEWSIPISEVRDGGPGKDGIPALMNPTFVSVNSTDASYISDNDLVLGLKKGNVVRAYPHAILDWHEIINDNVADLSVAITYCPLTGTGIGWNRMINGKESSFGVSGLLYNANLIPYDRATDSNWSQLALKSVNGELKDEAIETVTLIETDWKTWKQMFPETEVVSIKTGINRNYGRYPYGDYNTNNDRLIFPVNPQDNRLPLKERVHMVLVDGKAKAYRLEKFTGGNVFQEEFNSKKIIVVGNENFIMSYELDASLENNVFSFVPGFSNGAVLKDDKGNEWNAFGELISGNAIKLNMTKSMMAYWFSVPAFYETVIADN